MTTLYDKKGVRLKRAREIQGISVSLLAIRLNVSPSILLKMESGAVEIPDNISNICKSLNIRKKWLETGEGYPFEENKIINIIPERCFIFFREILKYANTAFAIQTEDVNLKGKYILLFERDKKIDVVTAQVSDNKKFYSILKNLKVQLIKKLNSKTEVQNNIYKNSINIRNYIHDIKNEASTIKAFIEGLKIQKNVDKFVKKHIKITEESLNNILERLNKILT